jgi:hypothetical protein
VTIAQKNEYLSSKDFVGTLSAGNTGFSVMELESYRSNGELLSKQFYKDSGEYGGPPPQHDCTLSASKAYFFLDGYAVCLGSDVTACGDNAMVYTVLENRKQRPVIEKGRVTGYAESTLKVNGRAVEVGATDTDIEDVLSFAVDNTAIVMLDGLRTVTFRKTEGSPSFTEAILKHGIDPKGEGYAYAILPDATKTEDFIKNTPVTVIRNDEDVQAVKENASGDRYLVFHKAAQCCSVSVDRPLLVAVKQDGIYVCDAAQHGGKATVTVDGESFDITFDGVATVKIK